MTLRRVLGQSYDYFITAKSSSISSQLLLNIQNITFSIIEPILFIISSTIVLLSIAVALIIAMGIQAIILLLILALRKFGMDASSDIGDKSVFEYLKQQGRTIVT